MKILAVNAGSSSLKFQLVEMPEENVTISGYIEKIGLKDSFWNTKVNGEKIKGERYLKYHAVESLEEIDGIANRVLHGGEKYSESVIITDEVIDDIKELTKLGPLHHPGNLAGIEAFKEALPKVKQVAVFDTAFHQTMPKDKYIFPVPYEWYKNYGVRKYGFHGTSHKFITEYMKEKLGKEDINLIICHIGSGASISCVKNGKCYDTTMGITPLDGLMMCTRSGSIDPSIIEYVSKESGMTVEEITNKLNKESGLLGISTYSDRRDVLEGALSGDEMCKLAIEMYDSRIANYIAEYFIELEGKVDAIIFTAGVGENSDQFREDITNRLKPIGLDIDLDLNSKIAGYKEIHEGKISTDKSSIDIYVIPTNEELMMVRDTYELVK